MSNGENPFGLGSNPTPATTFTEEIERSGHPDTDLTQETAESEAKPLRFPKVIKHRKAEVTIYGKSKHYPAYRLAWRAGGKRLMKSFPTYSEAKTAADKLVKDLAKGSKVPSLTSNQANDALIALERLETLYHSTGKRVGLANAVGQFCEVAALLGNHPLTEAVEGFLRSVAVVRPKSISEAVEEFIKGRAPKAIAKEPGKRSALNPKYVENTAAWLREFAATFPGNNVCDLGKEHLGAYIGAFEGLSAKSRNDRRAVVKQFLKWCMRADYLSSTHRLFEAEALLQEAYDPASIDYYRPNELRALLEAAEVEMRVVIALQGLAGLRLEEALRLDWRDVFGIPGHIELGSSKTKTRARRLVEICPALDQWLAPYRGLEGKVAKRWQTLNSYVKDFSALRDELKIPSRRNGLRHAFCSYHLALHSNENLTAALAGNSPAMLHASYKGLATKAESEKWFAVAPAKADNVVPMAAAAAEK